MDNKILEKKYRNQMYEYFINIGLSIENSKYIYNIDLDNYIEDGLSPEDAALQEIINMDRY